MNTIQNKLEKVNLHTELAKHHYICDKKTALKIQLTLMTSADSGSKGAYILGPVGVGKTFLVDQLAKIFDIPDERYLHQQMFTKMNEQDLIANMIPTDENTSNIKLLEGVIVKAARVSHEGATILLLDEWDKSMPTADSVLLDFLQTGRVNYKGIELKANLDNLYVFITMNDERALADAAERRLKVLEFNYMTPDVFRNAILEKRGNVNEEILNKCVTIYLQTIGAGLRRVATVQECVQMIDSIKVMGAQLTFDDYVKMHITKNVHNHNQFVKYVNSGKYNPKEIIHEHWGETQAINENQYIDKNGLDDEISKQIRRNVMGTSPLIEKILNEVGKVPDYKEIHVGEDIGKLYGYIDYTEKVYHQLALESKDVYGGEGELILKYQFFDEDKELKLVKNGDKFNIIEPLHILDYHKITGLFSRSKIRGSINFYAPHMTRNDVKVLIGNTVEGSMFIYYRKEANIVVAGLDNKTVVIRWERDLGVVLTIDLENIDYANKLLSNSMSQQSDEKNKWFNHFKPITSFNNPNHTEEDKNNYYGLVYVRELPHCRYPLNDEEPNLKDVVENAWINNDDPNFFG